VIRRLPLTRLHREQWQRLADFAALVALVCFLFYIGAETYLMHGVDFRGYYAAARVAMAGGDPYDYRLVSQVLLEATGRMGNNPYYYPPWFCLLIAPLSLLAFPLARLLWIVLTLLFYWSGAQIALKVLGWDLCGWQRWLAVLSGAYLFVWVSVRSEQLGTFLFFVTVLSLWGYQQDKPWLAGTTLALLLTKPNVTWLTVMLLGLFYLKQQPRAVWWLLAVLAGLLLVSTWRFPGWYAHWAEPGFDAGLGVVLDGPDQVESVRLNTTLRDWLGQWGIGGTLYRVVWVVLAAGSGLAIWLAWHTAFEKAYLTSLAGAVGLLLTPYALQYDYPLLILALFGIYQNMSQVRSHLRWIALAILGAVFSVPVWESPIYDGYWILLGIVVLLLLLNPCLWRWLAKKEAP
jgi:hypothetical protein